jgi:tetratricopeptide (TPR) repeat protein
MCTRLSSKGGIALALNNIGQAKRLLGDYKGARQAFQEALRILELLGDKKYGSLVMLNLGNLSYSEGDLKVAEELLQNGLSLSQSIGYAEGRAYALACLARSLVRTRSGEANLYLTESIEISGSLESVELSAFCQLCVGYYELSQEQYQKALGAFLNCTLQFYGLEERQYLPECLEAIALTFTKLASYSLAAASFGQANALRQSLHMPQPPVDAQLLLAAVGVCKLTLGSMMFERTYAQGQQLSLDKLLALASVSDFHGTIGLN